MQRETLRLQIQFVLINAVAGIGEGAVPVTTRIMSKGSVLNEAGSSSLIKNKESQCGLLSPISLQKLLHRLIHHILHRVTGTVHEPR